MLVSKARRMFPIKIAHLSMLFILKCLLHISSADLIIKTRTVLSNLIKFTYTYSVKPAFLTEATPVEGIDFSAVEESEILD